MPALPWRRRCAPISALAGIICAALVIIGDLAVTDNLGAFLRQPDFAAYYLAARADSAGASMYSDVVRMQLARELPQGVDVESTFYLYPPLFAAALQPIAAFPFSVAAAVWLVINAGLMGIVTFSLLRLYRWPRPSAVAGAAGSLLLPGAQQALFHGQIDWLPLGAIVLCLHEWKPARKPGAGGVLLGVAAAFKVFPLLLVSAAPPGRRVRTFALTAGGASACLAAGVLTGGGMQLSAWSRALAAHARRPFVQDVSNQGFAAVIGRAGHGYQQAAALPAPAWADAIATAVPIAIVAATVIATWYVPRRIPSRIDSGLRVTALVTAVLIALPAAWDHYHVLLVPGAVVMFAASRRSAFAWPLYVAGALLLLSHRFWRPLFVVAPTHVVLALGLLGTMAWWAASMWLISTRYRRDVA